MKKLISGFLCAAVLCFCSIVLFACGPQEVTISSVSMKNLQTQYQTTSTIPFDTFGLQVTYSDEKTENIQASDIEFDIDYKNAKKATKFVVTTASTTEGVKPLSQQTAGQYVAGTYKIAYAVAGKEKAEFSEIATITVSQPAPVTRTGISDNLAKTQYFSSESIFTDFALIATYSDDSQTTFTVARGDIEFDVTEASENTKFIVTTACTTEGVNPLSQQTAKKYTPGTYEIKYIEVGKENTTPVLLKTITVNAVEITSVTTTSITDQYWSTATIGFSAFTLKVTYNNGTIINVPTSEIEFDVETATSASTKFIVTTSGLRDQTAGAYTPGTYEIQYIEVGKENATPVLLKTVTVNAVEITRVTTTSIADQYWSTTTSIDFGSFTMSVIYNDGTTINVPTSDIEFDVTEASENTKFIITTASTATENAPSALSQQQTGAYTPGTYEIKCIEVGKENATPVSIKTVTVNAVTIESVQYSGIEATYYTTATDIFADFALVVTYSNSTQAITYTVANGDIEFDVNVPSAATKFIVYTNENVQNPERKLSNQTPGDYESGDYKITCRAVGGSTYYNLRTITITEAPLVDENATISQVTSSLNARYYSNSTINWGNFRLTVIYTLNDDNIEVIINSDEIEFDVETATHESTKFIVTTSGLYAQASGPYTQGSYEIRYIEVWKDVETPAEGKVGDYNVQIEQLAVTNATINGLNASYFENGNINWSNVTLDVTYNNPLNSVTASKAYVFDDAAPTEDTKFVITTASTATENAPSALSQQQTGAYTPGEYVIKCFEVGKTDAEPLATFTVTINAFYITNFSVNNFNKSSYFENETIDWDSITVNVSYSDSTTTNNVSAIEFDVEVANANSSTKFIITTAGLHAQTAGAYTPGTYAIKCFEVRTGIEIELDITAIEIIGIEIDNIETSSFADQYWSTDSISFNSFAMTVTYNNENSSTYDIDDVEFDVETATSENTKFIITTASTATENAPSALSQQTAGAYTPGTYQIKCIEVGKANATYITIKTIIINAVTIDSISASGFDDSYYFDEAQNIFANFALSINYSNGQSVNVPASEIEFDVEVANANSNTKFIITTACTTEGVNPLSQQTPGNYRKGVYVISYTWLVNNESNDLGEIEIVDERYLSSFAVPAYVIKYENNNDKTAEARQTDEGTFYKEITYTVGDDNEFIFKPVLEMSANADDDETFTVSQFYVDVTLEEETDLINPTWTAVDSSKWSFNNSTFGFTFDDSLLKANAADPDRIFRLNMTLADFVSETLTFSFTIADGYNVYNAIDLGRINLMDDTSDMNGAIWMRDNSGIDYDLGGRDQQIGVFYSETTSGDGYIHETNGHYVHKLYTDVWREFYISKGYDADSLKQVNGLFLHGDVVVTNDVIPSEYFITEAESAVWAGTLRDCLHPYAHYMKNDFTLNGNSFTIDFSKIKLCMSDCNRIRRNNSYTFDAPDSNGGVNVGQHLCESSAFTFFGKLEEMLSPGFTNVREDTLTAYNNYIRDNNAMPDYTAVPEGKNADTYTYNKKTDCVAYIKNVNLNGNLNSYDAVPVVPEGYHSLFTESSTRENFSVNSTEIWAGCLVGIKAVSTSLVADNCISKNFQMAWESETISYHTGLDINYVKSYDCFTTGLMTWCSGLDKVSNSELKRFGGPAVLIMGGYESRNNTFDWSFPAANVVIDENTTLESFVAGDEGWFTLNVATGIAPILSYLNDQIKTSSNGYYKICQEVQNPSGEGTLNKYNLRMLALDQNALTDGDTSIPTFTYTYKGIPFTSFMLTEDGTTNIAVNDDYGDAGMIMTPAPTDNNVLKDNLVLINPSVNLSASVSIGLGLSFEVVLNQ